MGRLRAGERLHSICPITGDYCPTNPDCIASAIAKLGITFSSEEQEDVLQEKRYRSSTKLEFRDARGRRVLRLVEETKAVLKAHPESCPWFTP